MEVIDNVLDELFYYSRGLLDDKRYRGKVFSELRFNEAYARGLADRQSPLINL